MAEALATILLDDALRSQMAEVMRRRVGSYYHKDRVTRLYEDALRRAHGAGPRLASMRKSMTSSNTTIEAMTRRGTLSGVLGAYLYAALLVAGPWIFTVLGLLGLGAATCDGGSCFDLTVFRSIVIYNSMYAPDRHESPGLYQRPVCLRAGV